VTSTERAGRHLGSAVRVAAITAAVTASVYLVLVAVLDLVVINRLDSQLDQQIRARLADGIAIAAKAGSAVTPAGLASVVNSPAAGTGHSGLGIYGAPVFVWQLGSTGAVLGSTTGAPALAAGPYRRIAETSTVTMGGQSFRVAVDPDAWGFLVAGASSAEVGHVKGVLIGSEGLALPALIVVVFLAALAVAARAVAPVEEARRRQLEFTADASHELRTPLSVLEAEVTLARSSPRDAAHYEETLGRVARESARLTRIVEDLLWLARFDAEPPPPLDEPIDLGTIADGCADRFSAVAVAHSIDLTVARDADKPVWIHAPPEWIDRLAGVLIDNACRYAGEKGQVRILVGVAGSRAFLAVDDSGPGIPENERARLFDRFHRATEQPGGHGLGLAIADSIVRSTGGRWRISSADLGGARMEVSWSRA
jgi:Histidine kinase-, DNA gyrase B-, and HSP90-like ATPase/His Kinase A (phospho-acceptor) domain